MLLTTLRPLYDLLRSAAWSFSIPVHFSPRCSVSVREPSCESIKIVSFATKKVNEWPVVVSLEASIMVGWPPDRANFSSGAGDVGRSRCARGDGPLAGERASE